MYVYIPSYRDLCLQNLYCAFLFPNMFLLLSFRRRTLFSFSCTFNARYNHYTMNNCNFSMNWPKLVCCMDRYAVKLEKDVELYKIFLVNKI